MLPGDILRWKEDGVSPESLRSTAWRYAKKHGLVISTAIHTGGLLIIRRLSEA